MPLPDPLKNTLKIPAIAAPMFLVSGPQLVIETCKAGIVGTFPALNQRSSEGFEQWLIEINEQLDRFEQETGEKAAPFGVNLIVHKTNPRLQADLELCIKHKVPLIITSLGAVSELVDSVHSYGGLIFHDVISLRHAEKASQCGVDGLILVCAGAGGHAGRLNPFAFVSQIRKQFDKTIILSGCISNGGDIIAATAMGADLAYLGTRFINTKESSAEDEYKEMITNASAEDIIYTPAISGVHGSFLKQSIVNAGLDPDQLPEKADINFGKELDAGRSRPKAWSKIWSAGQGVGSIDDIPSTKALCERLIAEYQQVRQTLLDQG